MNNKTIIIEFSFGIIWRIMEILECVIRKKKQKQNKSICLDPETFGLSG